MSQLPVRFSDSQRAKISAEAQREGVSASQWVRELVVAHLARLETQRENDQEPRS